MSNKDKWWVIKISEALKIMSNKDKWGSKWVIKISAAQNE